MVTKRYRRKGRSRKGNIKGILIGSALFIAGIIALVIGLHLSNSIPEIPPPKYEEIYAEISGLSREVGRIDHAIYKSLYEGGVPEKNIIFLAVKPKRKGRYDWDFTELRIDLSNENSARQIEKTISAELSPLEPKVRYSLKAPGQEIVYHIFALGFYTHKIRVVYGGRREAYSESLPKVALIIDDLGYEQDLASFFFKLELPLSFSILPLASHTQEVVREANKRGCELILHLPMEPKNYPAINPGSGALLTAMDERVIRKTLGNHLKRVPGVRGVNNHMGSDFTERRDKMGIVLSELKKRHLFYIDSRTTSGTVAFKLAKEVGVPVARRSVFLDNDLSFTGIKSQMARLQGIARHSGLAIGIGHPHEETLNFLRYYGDKLKKKVKIVRVSELVS